jgi:uncharacterized protein YfaT (DUF1175 family)
MCTSVKLLACDLEADIEELRNELFEAWFVRVWKKAVKPSPKTRGFISIHDTSWIRDLHTGKESLKDKTGYNI